MPACSAFAWKTFISKAYLYYSVDLHTLHIESPLGAIRLSGNGNALTELSFLDEAPTGVTDIEDDILQETARQLTAYFNGQRTSFSVPLEPSGTLFQQKVWEELLRIPCGATISYRELSIRLGDPLCIRAAAAANGKNPIGILIPCHRVIGSDGSLTGYAGGLWRKEKILEIEGVLRPQPRLF